MEPIYNIETLKQILNEHDEALFIKIFNTLHPQKELIHNWHIKCILHHLDAVEKGQIKRLIINMPPRSLKSICVNVYWSVKLLARNPSSKIISVSYSQELSNKHAQDVRFVMQSGWFNYCFPDALIARGNNTKQKFLTQSRGFRFATSVCGTLTGEGADFIIVDDPQTPQQVFSQKKREKINNWFDQTLVSRLNDRANGAIVVVSQRLHPNDLTGYLLKKGGWTVLTLPLIAPRNTKISINNYEYKRKKNEVLNKTEFDKKTINDLKRELGHYGFMSQYQQNPQVLHSQIVKKDWFRRYSRKELESIYDKMIIYQSWDCAIKVGKNSDYTVCITIGLYNNQYYLLNVLRKKYTYPHLKNAVIQMYDTYKPVTIIIEDKASGQQLIQEIQEHSSHIHIVPYNPKYDKVTRLVLITPLIESGNVFLPGEKAAKSWLPQFEEELLLFPIAEHDDQVDAFTQLIQWLQKQKATMNKYSLCTI